MREQEQSANTMSRAIVRTDQGVQEHESEQQAVESSLTPITRDAQYMAKSHWNTVPTPGCTDPSMLYGKHDSQLMRLAKD